MKRRCITLIFILPQHFVSACWAQGEQTPTVSLFSPSHKLKECDCACESRTEAPCRPVLHFIFEVVYNFLESSRINDLRLLHGYIKSKQGKNSQWGSQEGLTEKCLAKLE